MGPYDNEAADGQGCYVESSDWENGQWLMDGDGGLYVLPVDGDQVEGPESPVADRILHALRETRRDVLTQVQIRDLALMEVPPVLRRFSPEIGYYSA